MHDDDLHDEDEKDLNDKTDGVITPVMRYASLDDAYEILIREVELCPGGNKDLLDAAEVVLKHMEYLVNSVKPK